MCLTNHLIFACFKVVIGRICLRIHFMYDDVKIWRHVFQKGNSELFYVGLRFRWDLSVPNFPNPWSDHKFPWMYVGMLFRHLSGFQWCVWNCTGQRLTNWGFLKVPIKSLELVRNSQIGPGQKFPNTIQTILIVFFFGLC